MRHRRILVLVVASVLGFVAGTSPAQATPPKIWLRTYDGTTVQAGVSVAADPGNGNVYVLTEVGCCPFSTTDLIAYSSSGTKLWTVNSGDPAYDSPVAVTVDPGTHDVVFTGHRGRGLLTKAYSATGTLLWTKVRTVTGYELDAVGLVADGHGRVVVLATTTPDTGTANFLTLSYRLSTGDRVWLRHYGADLSDDDPVGIAADPALSRVYVTGSSMGTNFPELVTIAYDSATGGQEWIARNTGGDDFPVGVAVDTSNHHVYAVTSTITDSYEFNTFGYTLTGATAWHMTYHPDSGSNDEPVAVAVDSANGQVYVAGIRRKASNDIPTALVGYSSSGTQLWAISRDDGNETHGFPRVLAADPTTHHVYLGSDHAIDADHIASMTRAFSATGAAVWMATEKSPNAFGNAGPTAICVDPGHGQAYVTGAETDPNDGHAQMFAVAYHA